jgi:hypothetical protein
VNVAPIKRIALKLKYEVASLLGLRLFIGIHLAVKVGCDIVRSFGHRHAVFFRRPAAEVNHLTAFGAERLPGIVYPTYFSTALGASSNCHIAHRSPENLRDRNPEVRNANDTEFCDKVEMEFAARHYSGNSPLHPRPKIPTARAARLKYDSRCCAIHQSPSLAKSEKDACGKR